MTRDGRLTARSEGYSPVEVKVWGEFACFTRPEMKVERVTYPVITPSAASPVRQVSQMVESPSSMDDGHPLAGVEIPVQTDTLCPMRCGTDHAPGQSLPMAKRSAGWIGGYAQSNALPRATSPREGFRVDVALIMHREHRHVPWLRSRISVDEVACQPAGGDQRIIGQGEIRPGVALRPPTGRDGCRRVLLHQPNSVPGRGSPGRSSGRH